MSARLVRTFQDKTAIVTGAASGIGRALAERLAETGCQVLLADRDSAGVAAAAQDLRKSGADARSVTLDVTDPTAVEAAVTGWVRQQGRLDYLFNNAGIPLVGELRERRVGELEHLLRVNLHGVVYGTHAALRVMAEHRGGHIVNTGSMAGLVAKPGAAIYSASKYGVVGFSLAARAEGRGLGVRVSVVCPGFVATPMLDTIRAGQRESQRLRKRSGRAQTPHAAARAILNGVARNRAVIITPRHWRWVWWLTRLFPGLVDGLSSSLVSQSRQERLEVASASF